VPKAACSPAPCCSRRGRLAESSLWACTLLGLLADGHAEVQEEIAEAGGIELVVRLISSSAEADLAVAAVRTLAVLLADHGRNQDKAVAAGAVKALVHLLTERPAVTTPRPAGAPTSTRAEALSTLTTLSSVTTRTPLNTHLQSRAALKFGAHTVELSPESRAALSVELAEMVTIALGNLGSGSLKNRKAIRKAGGAALLSKLMELQPGSNLFHLAQWAHGIVALKAPGAIKVAGEAAASQLVTL